jgi:hypothetical protein
VKRYLRLIPILVGVLGMATLSVYAGHTYSLWLTEQDYQEVVIQRGQVGLSLDTDFQVQADAGAMDDLLYVEAGDELHHLVSTDDVLAPNEKVGEYCFPIDIAARADGNLGLRYQISLSDELLADTDPVFTDASVRLARDDNHDNQPDGEWITLSDTNPDSGPIDAVPALKSEQTANARWLACVTATPHQEEYQNNATVTVHTQDGEVLSASDSWHAWFRSVSGPDLDLLVVSHEVYRPSLETSER